MAYQIEVSRYHPRISPIVDTLLQDFSPFVIPNATKTIMQGHRGNVKCAEFVGSEGRSIISGSRYEMDVDGPFFLQMIETIMMHA